MMRPPRFDVVVSPWHPRTFVNRMSFRAHHFLVALLAASSLCFAEGDADDKLPADVIWIEGEAATRQTVTKHGWYDGVKKDTLSGNEWLSHFDAQNEGSAEYEIEVTQPGTYAFWLRANPVASKLSYRIDSGDWSEVDFQAEKRGQINIARDNKPDLRFIGWLKLGKVELQAGRHLIRFRMHSGAQNHGGIDCFVFSRPPFVPSGATKPTGKRDAGPDSWFAVALDDDPLSPESITDVSRLIESPAGKFGFLQRRGEALQFSGADQPTKFWAVNASAGRRWSAEQMTQAARWYRKHGINLVRQHTVIDAVGLLDREGRFDSQRLDHYDRWFAALKEQGIYTTWSVIYPHHGRFLQKHDDVDPQLFAELDRLDEQSDGRRGPIAVNDFINLDQSLQAVAWKYFQTLLDHVNPYTGLAYKDEPALAMLEFQNESNVFFYTLNVLLEKGKTPILSQRMRQAFFRFASEKYGSEGKANAAWGGKSMPGDDWQKGELRLMGAHHWGSDGPAYEFAGKQRRAGDYIEFLARLQRKYYSRRQRQVREAGFRGVTVATAWKSGGPAASMANLYADTAADAIDRHNYFGGGDGGHRIVEGKVNHASHLGRPGTGLLSLGLFQVADRPFVTSEVLQMAPNPWKAEAAPLLAFYGMGLQGWDATYWFAMQGHRMGDGWDGLGKYVVQTPHYMGQFPALAMSVHQDHLATGEAVAARSLTRGDVFAGVDTLGQSLAGGGHDTKELVGKLTTPPAALAVGQVTIRFGPEPGASTKQALDRYHDVSRRRWTSNTGQLVWDYGQRRFEVRSSKTQAVVGFVDSPSVSLPDVELEIDTPFVSLIFTPLDDSSLKESRHVLITAMARDRQTGTKYNDDQSRLITVGGPPLWMEPVQAMVRFKGSRPVSVRPCDLYGVPREDEIDIAVDGSFRLDGRSQTYYYEVRR